MNNDQRWKAFDARRWGYLAYGDRVFLRALRDSYTLNNDFTFEVTEDSMRLGYDRLYRRVMRKFGEDTFQKFKSDPALRITKTLFDWDDLITQWLERNTFGLIKSVSDYTRRALQMKVEQALQDGIGIEEFARQMENDYLFSRQRSRLIARTEIIRASNAGSLLGARQTGLPMKKIWISTPDNRTRGNEPDDRFDHRNVPTVNSLDALFNVSGEFLEFPGDHTNGASPGNSINCRCAIGYEPY